jgi:hypothetical protein
MESSWALVAHTCNPSYLWGWDGEGCESGPAWANSSQDPVSKITRTKWTGGVAQVTECKALSSHISPTKTKTKPATKNYAWHNFITLVKAYATLFQQNWRQKWLKILPCLDLWLSRWERCAPQPPHFPGKVKSSVLSLCGSPQPCSFFPLWQDSHLLRHHMVSGGLHNV